MDIARLNHAITTCISQQDRAQSNNDYQAWREMQSTLEQARDAIAQAQVAANAAQSRDYTASQAVNLVAPDYLEAFNPRILEQQMRRGPGRPPKA